MTSSQEAGTNGAGIVVAGSLNMDLVTPVKAHPKPGETVLGGDTKSFPGGKGANQAVAAARAGASVKMLGCVGSDSFGEILRRNLMDSGVDAGLLERYDGPSGMAFITVDRHGQNMIVVSPGANAALTPARVPASALSGAGLLVMQLEIPLETVAALAEEARALAVPVLLNPAPAQPLSAGLLSRLDYLVVNESEAEILSGQTLSEQSFAEDALVVARALRAQGPKRVILTLGGNGLLWSAPEGEGHLAAHEVEVVDTTAAGDAFCGVLAAQLSQGSRLVEALRVANAAAAISVTRQGAQPSLPQRREIELFLARR